MLLSRLLKTYESIGTENDSICILRYKEINVRQILKCAHVNIIRIDVSSKHLCMIIIIMFKL